MDWNYFDKFKAVIDKYMPDRGEGETMASQIVTAVNKLVYKWYNDGDVYDNVHSPMKGWVNDLSSYANWLAANTPAKDYLMEIMTTWSDEDYEDLLATVADTLLKEDYLERMNREPKYGSIYACDGPFEFSERYDDDDDEEDY